MSGEFDRLAETDSEGGVADRAVTDNGAGPAEMVLSPTG